MFRRAFSRSPFLLVALAVLATPACYTLLKHPKVRREVYVEINDKRCSNCHVEDELWSYHHPPNQRYTYIGTYPRWGIYYSMPWWYNEYWYIDKDDISTVPLPSRHFRPERHKDLSGTAGAPATTPIASPAKNQPKETSEGSSNGEQSKKRTDRNVRPKTKKKDNG